MKHVSLALALIIPVALATSACSVLSGVGEYDTPAVSGAVLAVNADGLKLAADTAKANADRTVDPLLLPVDIATIAADGAQLSTDKTALVAAIAAAKVAGAQVTPGAIAVAN